MIIDVECPDCHGNGEVCGVTPSRRSRFVGYDDLSPDDYTRPCPRCLGSGVVDRWWSFSDAQIRKMDGAALEFWHAHKATLKALCDATGRPFAKVEREQAA